MASDFDDVLEKIPASWKITLLQIRWKLMPAEKLIARITKDVKTIKSLCMIDHREDWLQFIVSTMLYLKIFSKTIPGNTEKDLSTLLAQLQEEFNATSDLHLKNSYMIDRIDMYDYLLKNVNWVNSVPSEFSSIIMKCIRDNFFFNGYINNVWDEFREYILDDLNYRYNEMRKLVRNHEVLTEFIFDNLTDVNECRYTSHDYNKNQFQKWILSIYYTARQSTSLDYDYLTFRKFIDTLMKENINPFHIITEYGVTESNPIQDAFAVIANHLRSRKHIVLIMCVAYIENKRNSNYDRSLLEILT